MQKKINNYDQTKKMLNTLRGLNESRTVSDKLIREAVGQFDSPPNNFGSQQTQQPVEFGSPKEITASNAKDNGIFNINDVDIDYSATGTSLKDNEQNAISQLIDNFRAQVSQIVNFDPGITIDKQQLRLDGILTDIDVKFTLIAGKDEGVYLNADMLKMEQETLNTLTKLFKFGSETFKTAMEPIITKTNNAI
jgi:hypothetical protein